MKLFWTILVHKNGANYDGVCPNIFKIVFVKLSLMLLRDKLNTIYLQTTQTIAHLQEARMNLYKMKLFKVNQISTFSFHMKTVWR